MVALEVAKAGEFRPDLLRGRPPFSQLSERVWQELGRYDDWPPVDAYNDFAGWVASESSLGPVVIPTAGHRRRKSCASGGECAPIGGASWQVPEFREQDRVQVRDAGGYEAYIERELAVPTRARSWHDLFNALIWAHYPAFKWTAHRIQLREQSSPAVDPRNNRTIIQSRAAQFDEGGVVLVVDDPALLEPIHALDWTEFFVDRREVFGERLRCQVVGHALLEALVDPFIGITAKALALQWPSPAVREFSSRERVRVDGWLATVLDRELERNQFLPLPVLGVPGWHPEQTLEFYAQRHYFRTHARQAAVVPQP